MIKKFKNKLLTDTHFNELFLGSSSALFLRLAGLGLGYIFTLLIARWYGAGTMGLYALALTMLNIFATFGIAGFDNALVKFVADYNSNDKPYLIKEIYLKAVFLIVPVTIFLSAMFYLNADFLALNIFHAKELIPYLQLAAFALLPFVLLRVNSSFFQGLKDIKRYAFFQYVMIPLLSIIALILIFAFKENDGIATVIAQTIAIILSMFGSFISMKHYSGIMRNALKKILFYSTILKVSFSMLLTASLSLIVGWSDIIMIGIFENEIQVGIYSVVVKLATLTSIALIAINTIAAPKFSELYSKNDFDGLKKIAQDSTKMIFYSTLPIIIIFILFPKLILGIFGKEFIAGASALWILMAGQFVNAMTGSVGYMLNMTNKHIIFNWLILCTGILNIILNYYLIPLYSITGAAIATAISLAILNIVSLILVKIYYGFYSINLFALIGINK